MTSIKKGTKVSDLKEMVTTGAVAKIEAASFLLARIEKNLAYATQQAKNSGIPQYGVKYVASQYTYDYASQLVKELKGKDWDGKEQRIAHIKSFFPEYNPSYFKDKKGTTEKAEKPSVLVGALLGDTEPTKPAKPAKTKAEPVAASEPVKMADYTKKSTKQIECMLKKATNPEKIAAMKAELAKRQEPAKPVANEPNEDEKAKLVAMLEGKTPEQIAAMIMKFTK